MTLPVPKYALGTALWTSAELLLELPGHVLTHIEDRLSDKNHWRHFHAQDLGMILVGVTAQAKLDPKKWSRRAAELFAFLVDQYRSRSALFYDVAFGPRRRFASFATQTYLTLACYAYGELANDIRAIDIANACTRKLIALQGPNGEWPWFFDAALDRFSTFTRSTRFISAEWRQHFLSVLSSMEFPRRGERRQRI